MRDDSALPQMKGLNFLPEAEFLVSCARMEMLPGDIARAETAVRRRLDWKRVLSLAHSHGVLAMVHRHASAGVFGGLLPPDVLAELHSAALAQTRRNLHLTSELVVLLRLFAAHEIPVMPLKGPILSDFIYGSVGMRRMLDLDFLFKEADVERVVTLLGTRGYRTSTKAGPYYEEIRRRTNHELPLVSKIANCRVEVHYHLLLPRGRVRCGLERIMPRTQAKSFKDLPILTLLPEDLLVYLCEHGAGHCWSRLEWLCAIAELIRSQRIQDWDRVTAFAKEFKGRRRLVMSLLLARELFGVSVPEEMLAADPLIRKSVRSIVAGLLTRPESPPSSTHALLCGLATDGSPAASVERIWTTLITPHEADFQTMPLPRVFWPAYSLLRPFRLVARYARRVVSRRSFDG